MGAQEAHTSRWPADTWSWLSPPSSACTSRGQPRHNDCGEHLWILFDIADGWNQIWYSLLKSPEGEIISGTLCGGFFLFCFALLFGEFFCHVNTMMFFFIIIIISFLLLWLIDHLVNQCTAPAPLHLHSYQKPPNFPNELLLSLFLYQVVAQNWHFHPFLYMAKKTQLCQVSQYTELPYQCCMECIMGCWTKDKTFRFLTIQIQIIECA